MTATVLFWTIPILLLAYAPDAACLVGVVATVLACFDNQQGDF